MENQINDQHKIVTQLQPVLDEFTGVFSAFGPEQINMVPYPGSWTPGQLARHINKSLSGFVSMLNGAAVETDRDPAEKVTMIRDGLLNFEVRYQSPQEIVPEEREYDKKILINDLDNNREQLLDAAQTHPLDQTCTGAEIPGIGSLTRLEAVSFALYHTQRHIRQLQNMREKFINDHAAANS